MSDQDDDDDALSEEKRERQRVEWVFGLTGGELEDKPWTPWKPELDETEYEPGVGFVPAPRFDQYHFRYHYDGAPDYCGKKHGDDCVTAVACDAEPEVLYEKGRRYDRVAVYSSSGERECPCAEARREGTFEGEDREGSEPRSWCPLCETDDTDDSHYIYLGDGWCETVYTVTRICEACGGALTSHRDYGDDRCLVCEPYAFEVKREDDDEQVVLHEGSDAALAELAYEAHVAGGEDVYLYLDGELIKSCTQETKIADCKRFIDGLFAYPHEDWNTLRDRIRAHVDAVPHLRAESRAYVLAWADGYQDALCQGGPSCLFVYRHWLDGKLVEKRKSPVGERWDIPSGRWPEVVSFHTWVKTGAVAIWPSDPETQDKIGALTPMLQRQLDAWRERERVREQERAAKREA